MDCFIKMFKITIIGLNKFVVVLSVVNASISDGNINIKVRVELMTKPVVFGGNVTLACMIHNNSEIQCDKINRLWEGGPLNKVLLINGVSVDQTKYVETIDDPCKGFSMIIQSFDLTDLNCSYRCSYGLESSRKELQLDNASFIAKPGHNTTKVAFSKDKSHYNVTIDIARVYPLPQCLMTVGRITNDLTKTKVSGIGIYKNVTLQHRYSIREICPECRPDTPINLSCSLIKVNVLEYRDIINCSDDLSSSLPNSCFYIEQENSSLVLLYCIIGILTALFIIGVVYGYWKWRNKRSITEHEHELCRIGNQNADEQNCLTDSHHKDCNTGEHSNTTNETAYLRNPYCKYRNTGLHPDLTSYKQMTESDECTIYATNIEVLKIFNE